MVLCGVCGLAVLTMQSAAWMALRSTGELQLRCRRLASGVWWIVLLGYGGVAVASLATLPRIPDSTLICAFAVMALAGLICTHLCLSVGFDLGALAGATCVIAGLIAGAAAGQFPNLSHSVTVYTAGSGQYGTSVSAMWWIPAFAVAVGYNMSMHRLLNSQRARQAGQFVRIVEHF